jgi:hypothetical protein
MDPERQRVHDRIVDQQRRVDRLLEGRSDDEVRRRPTPERWSLGEHLEHLAITAELYVDLLQDAFARARDLGWTADAPYRRGPVGSLAVRAIEPPVRLKLPAPKIMRPSSDAGREQVAARFHRAHDAFLEVLSGADDVDLGRTLVRWPVPPLLRFRAIQACELVAAHVERHLWLIDKTGAAEA